MILEISYPGTGGFLSPKKVIESFDFIKEGMIVADFGCGGGYFTFPLAEKVGETGKVFAIDVLKEPLEVIESKARIEGFKNIKTIRGDLEKEGGSCIKDNFCDIILIANLFFQTEKDEAVVKEAKRVLKDNGYIIFIDWKKDVSIGPKGKRVDKEEVKKLFEKEGFILKAEFSPDDYHFGLIFKRE
jgi:ubiquinone/menaquinone biosynthesis C-methylase UbiE